MTSTAIDTVSAHAFVDCFDLVELTETGMLRFRIGNRDFELRTGPRPTDGPCSFRVTDEHLESLRTTGRIEFRRKWGRLTVSMQTEDAR